MRNFIFYSALSVLLPVITFAQLEEDSVALYYNQGKIEFQRGLFTHAKKNYERALFLANDGRRDDRTKNAILLASGENAMKLNRKIEAKSYYDEVVQKDSSNMEALRLLMDWNYVSRDYEEAIRLANKCDCSEKSKVLGNSYFYLKQYGDAKVHLMKAVQDFPKESLLFYRLGHTLVELGQMKEAVVYLKRCTELSPESRGPLYELALALYNSGDYKSSLAYMDRVEKLTKANDLNFYDNLTFISIYARDKGRANYSIQRLMKSKPNNVPLLTDIAYAWFETKDYEEAEKYFKKLFEIDPKNASALYMQGLSIEKLGNPQGGRQLINKALEMDISLRNYIKQSFITN